MENRAGSRGRGTNNYEYGDTINMGDMIKVPFATAAFALMSVAISFGLESCSPSGKLRKQEEAAERTAISLNEAQESFRARLAIVEQPSEAFALGQPPER